MTREKKSQTSPDLNELQAEIDQLRQDLQQSRDQCASILNTSPDGIVITGLGGRIFSASPSAIAMFGFKDEKEVEGKSLTHFIIPSERPSVALQIARILQGQKLGLIEYSGFRADETIFAIEVNAEILRDTKGHPSRFMVMIRDITERKQAVEELRESEAKNRALIHAIPDLILTNRRDGECLSIHTSNPQLLVMPAEKILHRKLNELLPQLLADQCLKAIENALDLNTTQDLTYSISKGGQDRHFEARVSPCTDDTAITIVRDITERKQVEERLRISAQLLDSVKEAVVASDMEGHILYWGLGAESLYGYKAEEVLGKDYRDFAGAIDPPDEEAFRQEVLAAGSWRGEHLQKNKNGETFWSDFHISVVRNEQGQPSGFIGIDQDITERKRAEQALRDSEVRYRTLFETHSDGILIADVETRKFRYTNPAVQRIFGYTEEEFLALAVANLHPQEALPHVIAEFEAQARGEITLAENLPCVRKDGSIFHADINTSCIQLQGRPCNVGFFRDITERKQAEAELKARDMAYFELFNTVKQAIYIQNPDSTFINVNQGALNMYGYERKDFIGKSPEFLSAPGKNDMDEVVRLVGLAFQGHPQKFEFWGRRKNGEIFPKDVWVVKGKYFGKEVLITLADDITERKQAEEEKSKLEASLQQARKMESIGRLAGGVAHDFNNMLGVILGRTEMGLEQVTSNPPLQEDLLEIQKAAKRSADLTRQLLAFARKQTVMPQVLDLNKRVESILQMLQRLIGEEIKLNWYPAAKMWPVRIDPSQIDQILTNLYVNARDAIEGIGQISIKTGIVSLAPDDCIGQADRHPGDFVLLSVHDTGKGIDKKTLKHIFEPFFTTKGMGKGTGLGLATVYGAIQQNKGFIEVSSNPSKGTIFHIYLPRHMGKIQPIKTEKIEPATQRGEETILLVEDEPAILEVTAKMLKRQGYTVLSADTPGKAIQMARENHGEIHLLITDVVMPEMNGRDLARTLLSLYPQIKRLFMSGYPANVIAHQGVLNEGVCFIQKPFTQKQFLTQVRQVLDSE